VVSATLFAWPGASSPPTLGLYVEVLGAEPAGRIWMLKVLGSSVASWGACYRCVNCRAERENVDRRTADPPSVDILNDGFGGVKF